MKQTRRFDLDWLRVLVFALLIFYHVGMFFVPWGWHIKNNVVYDVLIYPMAFVNQWRLPILFVISGMGTYYAFSKRTAKEYRKERWTRLGIPLLFGILVIVPPQIYLERVVNGQFDSNYFAFWPWKIFSGIYPEGNFSWHHLWFLPYLLVFSLLLAGSFKRLRSNPDNRLSTFLNRQLQRPIGFYWFLIPLYLFEAFLEPFFPRTHALIGDWFNLANYGFLFFAGFCLMTVKDTFWARVEQWRSYFLIAGVLLFSVQVYIWMAVEDTIYVHFSEALVKVANIWSWILTLFGFAAHYLNRPSKVLSYANQAVYPFYILHQTITLVIGFYLMHLDWSLGWKAGVMILGTFMGSWIIYEFLVRRIAFLRPLFGLKPRTGEVAITTRNSFVPVASSVAKEE